MLFDSYLKTKTLINNFRSNKQSHPRTAKRLELYVVFLFINLIKLCFCCKLKAQQNLEVWKSSGEGVHIGLEIKGK
jgi:hypothetical protein